MKLFFKILSLVFFFQTTSNAQWVKVLGKNNLPNDAYKVIQLNNNFFTFNDKGIYYSNDKSKNWKLIKLDIFRANDDITYLNYLATEKGLFAVVNKRNSSNNIDSVFLLFTSNLGNTFEIKEFLTEGQFYFDKLSCVLIQTNDYVNLYLKVPTPIYLRIRKDSRQIEYKNFTKNAFNYFVTEVAEYIIYSSNNVYVDINYNNGNKVTKLIPYNSNSYGTFLKDSLILANGVFSKDFGQSWYEAGASLPNPQGRDQDRFYFAFKNKIYSVVNAKVYSSLDEGRTWSLESSEIQKYCGAFNPQFSIVDSILSFSYCTSTGSWCDKKYTYNVINKKISYLNTERIYPYIVNNYKNKIIKLQNGKLVKATDRNPYVNFVSSDSGSTWLANIDYPFFNDRINVNDTTFYAFDYFKPYGSFDDKYVVRFLNNVKKDTLSGFPFLTFYDNWIEKDDTIIAYSSNSYDTIFYSIRPFTRWTKIPLKERAGSNLLFFENGKIYAFSKDILYGDIKLSLIGLDGSVQKIESLQARGTMLNISEANNLWFINGNILYNTKDLGVNLRSISTVITNFNSVSNDYLESVLTVIKKGNVPNEKILIVTGVNTNYSPYISVDSGKTWIFFNLGLEKEKVLALQQIDNYLFATTENAIFKRSIDDILLRLVSGAVFFDENGNTIFDRNEKPVINTKVYSTVSNAFSFTDSLGKYTVLVDVLGADTLKIDFDNKYASILPRFHLLTKSDTGKNFAVKLMTNVNDVKINVTAITPLRPGFNNEYQLNYKNIGSTILNGNITFAYNVEQNFVSASSTFLSNSNQILTWAYSNLQPNESRTIKVTFKTATDVPVRSLLTNIANITPLSIDTFKTDNTDTLVQTVVGSYDPNDKQVTFNNSKTPPLVIDPSTELIYTIRFQNTGNYPADFVKVVDTLSDKLDLTTFRLIAASHKGDASIRNKNVLTFDFNPIYLPDSVRDEKGSHGFIKFAITPKKTLTKEEAIKNTGYIYFDYNPAIITNTVETANQKVNSIFTSSVLTENLKIYPNPANRSLNIEIEDEQFKEGFLNIYDMTGRLILSQNVSNKQSVIDVGFLSAGEFICTIKSKDNKIFVNKFIKVE